MTIPTWYWAFHPLVFAGTWILVCFVLGRKSGWTGLAESYPENGDFNGDIFRLRSGRLGGVAYSGCLSLGVNRTGLRIAILAPFRLWHPPVFIPWSEVSAVARKYWFQRIVVLQFKRRPEAELALGADLAAAVARASDTAFRLPSPPSKD